MNKDYPSVDINRKSEIYYYDIETDKNPDLNKVNYTEHEKQGNFKLELIFLDKVIHVFEDNIYKNEKIRLLHQI